MSFYNQSWVRKLLKEDHKNIIQFINKRDKSGEKFVNDLRDYIDATIPFTLYLDLNEIKSRVLDKNKALIKSIADEAYPEGKEEIGFSQVYSMLLGAYKKVINDYISNPAYIETSTQDLERLLKGVTDENGVIAPGLESLELGKIKAYISAEFKKTRRLTSLSKKNSRVCLIFPKFTSVDFNKKFRDAIDFSVLDGDVEYLDSPSRKVKEIFGDIKRQVQTQLQNIGHIEVDVVGTGSIRQVKRSQLSPRFIQALIVTPNNEKDLLRVSKKFSKETKQSTTRLRVRKQFTDKRLVLELLVESNMMVGLPESQRDNLEKATAERGFSIGSGLTAQIRKNPGILIDLETSKSIKEFIGKNFLSLLNTGKGTSAYNSNSEFKESLAIPVISSSIKIGTKTKSSKTINVPKIPRVASYTDDRNIGILTRLPNLINQALAYQIQKNMGNGNRRDVLNYRTGRFANSAKVEKVSQSRQGLITLFYSYMKNPYATFSKGGRQEMPTSRDPKLLISKSIREIAQTIVSTRLRAVNV